MNVTFIVLQSVLTTCLEFKVIDWLGQNKPRILWYGGQRNRLGYKGTNKLYMEYGINQLYSIWKMKAKVIHLFSQTGFNVFNKAPRKWFQHLLQHPYNFIEQQCWNGLQPPFKNVESISAYPVFSIVQHSWTSFNKIK